MERETFQHHWNYLINYLQVLHYYLKPQLCLKLNLYYLYTLSHYHFVHYLHISVIVNYLALGGPFPNMSTRDDVVQDVPYMYILVSFCTVYLHELDWHMLCIDHSY